MLDQIQAKTRSGSFKLIRDQVTLPTVNVVLETYKVFLVSITSQVAYHSHQIKSKVYFITPFKKF